MYKPSATNKTLKFLEGIIGQNLTIVQSGDESYQTTSNSLESLNRRALNSDNLDGLKNSTDTGFSKVRREKIRTGRDSVDSKLENSKNFESSKKSKSKKKNEIKGMMLTRTGQPIRWSPYKN